MIPCIHKEDNKTSMTIKFSGKQKQVSACGECVNVIESSELVEVLS